MAEHNSLESNPLYQKLMDMRNVIFAERILDMYFFGPETVDVAEVMVNEFLSKSTELIATIDNNMLFDRKLDKCFKELKESSAKIGAHKVNKEVNETVQHIQRGDMQSAMASFYQMKMEVDTVKERLDAFIELGYQVKAAMMANAIDEQKKT
ncbi:hypothetical protein Ddye_030154 [Dipteronia dyeriana]|uniref:Histidine-containing phosphotransfer protein n=1 Tax=Dipteronia dyeriana TaxID=168575 RepID=A0AAD9TFX8_9ROSI|nr:hypothetical protein Ddye_030154 [Dipteronia dyeriana]